MLQSLAALVRPQVPDDAEMAVAHPSQMAVLEGPHALSMHWPAIPSTLGRFETSRAGANRGLTFPSAPAAFGGIRSHPNADLPPSIGDAKHSVVMKDSSEVPGRSVRAGALGRRDASHVTVTTTDRGTHGAYRWQSRKRRDT
jgi:hypothetical protein